MKISSVAVALSLLFLSFLTTVAGDSEFEKQINALGNGYESIHAVAVQTSSASDQVTFYVLAKRTDRNQLVLIRIDSPESIAWTRQLSIDAEYGPSFVNQLSGQLMAKPQIQYDQLTQSVLVSGWISTGPPATLGHVILPGVTAVSVPGSKTRLQHPDYFWSDLCWSPELRLFVVVGFDLYNFNGSVALSSDGMQWTEVNTTGFDGLRAVTWSSEWNSFAAVGFAIGGPVAWTSSDGWNWTKQEIVNFDPDLEFRSVIWSPLAGGCFIANGGHPTAYNNIVWATSCGSPNNWTMYSNFVPNVYYMNGLAVAPKLGVVVAVAQAQGGSGYIYYSLDGGGTWVQNKRIVVNGIAFVSIAWSPLLERFAGCGVANDANLIMRIAVSAVNNYTSWSLRKTGVEAWDASYQSIRWFDDLKMFIVTATNSLTVRPYFLSSTDGLTWTLHQNVINTDFASNMAFYSASTGSFVIVGNYYYTNSAEIFTSKIVYPTEGQVARYSAAGVNLWTVSHANNSTSFSIMPTDLTVSQQVQANPRFFDVSGSRMNFTSGQIITFVTRFDFTNGSSLITKNYAPRPAGGDSFALSAALDESTDDFLLVGFLREFPRSVTTAPWMRFSPFIAKFNASTLLFSTLSVPTMGTRESAFMSIHLNQQYRRILVMTLVSSVWTINSIPYQTNIMWAQRSTFALSSDSLSKTGTRWLLADSYSVPNQPSLQLFAARLDSSKIGRLIVFNLNYTDSGSPVENSLDYDGSGLVVDLQAFSVYFDRNSQAPMLAASGSFNSTPVLLILKYTHTTTESIATGTIKSALSQTSESTSTTITKIALPQTSESTSTTTTVINTATGKPIDAGVSAEMMTYIIVGGVVAVVLLAAALMAIQLKRTSLKFANNGMRMTRLGYSTAIMPSTQSLSYESSLKLTSTTATGATPLSFPHSVAAINQTISSQGSPLRNTFNLNTVTNLATNSTLFTNSHQGIYVPGHYLVNTNNAVYQPIKKIYNNQNCEVFCAQALDQEICKRCKFSGGTIAVKTMKKLNNNFIESFYQEISIMYFFVGKPNFVQLVGFCNAPYQILTEYYSLGNLEQALLKRKYLLPSKRLMISSALQISRALNLMHESGFSHSDIKALNIFVDRDRFGEVQCYLGDFGLAKVLDDVHLVVKAYKVLNLKGLTVAYAAPEVLQQLKSQTVSAWSPGDFLRADAYAFGILLFEITNCILAWKDSKYILKS